MRAGRLTAGAVLIAVASSGQAVKADPGDSGSAVGRAAAPVLAALPPSEASLTAERLLTAASDASVVVTRDVRGLAHRVGSSAGHPIPLPEGVSAAAPAVVAARAHLGRMGALFGLTDVSRELELVPRPEALAPAAGEDRIVKFQQVRDGLRVLGGELVVVLDPAGALRSVLGETLPGSVGLAPAAPVTAEQAAETAVAVTSRAHPAYPAEALRASEPERWYLDPALIGVPDQVHMPAGPVWRTEVTGPADVRELVLVDSRTGTVPLQLNQIAHAISQVVCDKANRADKVATGSDCKSPYARKSPSSASGKTETDEAYDNTTRTSRYFDKYLDVDLTKLLGVDTGDGKKLRSTVRFCPRTTLCSASGGTLFDNAFWNGRGLYYGNGWQRADDVVAHELGHGLTDKTSRLLYLYQSGAINESMADVIGELTDQTDGFDAAGVQTDWIVAEDAPLEDALRNMANPTQLGEPDRMTSPFYKIDLLFQDSGSVHANSGVGNKAVYLIVAGTSGEIETPGAFNGQTITGIGIPKASVLYLRAQRMLTSGADYADLDGVLNQACSDLVGKLTIVKSDCTTVARAVTATEMSKQPTPEAATAPEAGFCPSGTSRDNFFADGFETDSRRWSYGSRWVRIRDYAKEGDYSVYGVEPDYETSSSLTLTTSFSIPRRVQTYLRFAHQYRLDSGIIFDKLDLPTGLGPYYDGARLEYRVAGKDWRSATGLPWQIGPRKKITPEGGGSYTAFGGDSHGYVASRVDLTSLAGKTVKFRWKVLGDKQIAFDGWTIDDVRLFACGAEKPSNVASMTVTAGRKKVTVDWKEPLYTGGGITGYTVDRSGASSVKVSKTSRSYAFGGLKKGKRYTFTIVPRSKGGAGPTSSRTATAR